LTENPEKPRIPRHPRDVEKAFASRLRDIGWSREARQLSQGKSETQIAHEAAEAGREPPTYKLHVITDDGVFSHREFCKI
jgi:16S rRNA G1207 methylase RsmC